MFLFHIREQKIVSIQILFALEQVENQHYAIIIWHAKKKHLKLILHYLANNKCLWVTAKISIKVFDFYRLPYIIHQQPSNTQIMMILHLQFI